MRLASAGAVRTAIGYSIGGVPPVGLARPLRVIMDSDLLGYDRVWVAARHRLLRHPQRLRVLPAAAVVELRAN